MLFKNPFRRLQGLLPTSYVFQQLLNRNVARRHALPDAIAIPLITTFHSSRTKMGISGSSKKQQIGTKLSHDALNPTHVPF